MNQSINFLKTIPKQVNYLPAQWLGFALAVLILFLTGVSINQKIASHFLSQQLQTAQAKHLNAANDFQKLATAYPLLAQDKPLVELVSNFEAELIAKHKQFTKMTHATLRNPFSSYLHTLADIVPQGLWLTRIYIDQDTENVSLAGYSILPVFVSVLLQKLQSASPFKALYFDLFYVKKVPEKDYIQFEVANDYLLGPEDEAENNTTMPVRSQSDYAAPIYAPKESLQQETNKPDKFR